MRSRSRRTLITAGIAIAATAAVVPMQMAAAAPPAGGGFYGVWTLKSWDMNGQVLPCPVQLTLPPPAPSIGCGPGTFLKLFRNGTYTTNLPVFESNEADAGVFVVGDLGAKKGYVIVFDDNGDSDAPRAYRLAIAKKGSTAPKKMDISLAMFQGGTKMTIAMNFVRYTG